SSRRLHGSREGERRRTRATSAYYAGSTEGPVGSRVDGTLYHKVHCTVARQGGSVSALVRFFFSPVYAPQSAWSILGWWESRRPVFNAVLAVAGVLSLAAQSLFALLPPSAAPGVPLGLVGIVAYAVLANLCYSAGAVAELYIRRRWGDGYAVVGIVPYVVPCLMLLNWAASKTSGGAAA